MLAFLVSTLVNTITVLVLCLVNHLEYLTRLYVIPEEGWKLNPQTLLKFDALTAGSGKSPSTLSRQGLEMQA